MCCGDCDAAKPKLPSALTHRTEPWSQEVGSGDERACWVLICHQQKRTCWWHGERAVETWPIFVFRVTFYVHRGSGQARVYPRRWLSLSSRAKAFTLQGRHRRFVGDSAFHTSLRGAPLLVGEQRSGIIRFCKKYRIWCHMTAYHRVLFILLYGNMHLLISSTTVVFI